MSVYHVSIAIDPTEPLNCQSFDIRVWRTVRKYNLTSISYGRNECENYRTISMKWYLPTHNNILHRPSNYNWINYNSIHNFSQIWLIGPCSTIHSSYNIPYYEESSFKSSAKKAQALRDTKPLFFHVPQRCQKTLKSPRLLHSIDLLMILGVAIILCKIGSFKIGRFEIDINCITLTLIFRVRVT